MANVSLAGGSGRKLHPVAVEVSTALALCIEAKYEPISFQVTNEVDGAAQLGKSVELEARGPGRRWYNSWRRISLACPARHRTRGRRWHTTAGQCALARSGDSDLSDIHWHEMHP